MCLERFILYLNYSYQKKGTSKTAQLKYFYIFLNTCNNPIAASQRIIKYLKWIKLLVKLFNKYTGLTHTRFFAN